MSLFVLIVIFPVFPLYLGGVYEFGNLRESPTHSD